jgi:hypothetical protein
MLYIESSKRHYSLFQTRRSEKCHRFSTEIIIRLYWTALNVVQYYGVLEIVVEATGLFAK